MKFIKNHPIVAFYSIVILLTGFLFFVPALVIPSLSFPFYLLAPALVAFMLTAVMQGGNSVKIFTIGLFAPKLKWKWLVISSLMPIIIIFAADILMKILQKQPISYLSSANPITPSFVLMVFIGCVGEEIGWRGFLLPLLLKKQDAVHAGILLGLLWGLWHIGDYGEGLGFLLFVVSTIAMTIIMIWFYQMGNYNLITAVLFHFFYNLSGSYVGVVSVGGVPGITYRAVMAIVCVIPAIALVLIYFRPQLRHSKCARH